MLKDIASIEISGANFSAPTFLNLFEPTEGNKIKIVKGSLLYGRNGSGKSTIARGFRKVAGEDLPAIGCISVLNKDGQPISLTENEKKHIFVFDEDYVDKNVKLQEDHLDTIIMLGEQVDLAAQIKLAESERDTAKASLDDQQKLLDDEYYNSTNIKSPKYHLARLRFALQGDDNWAGRDKRIREHRQNTGVNDATYKQFLDISPSKPRDELLVEFKRLESELATVKAGSLVINHSVPSLPSGYDSYDESEIQKLLLEKIEKPILSKREEYLLELVQHGQAQELVQRKTLFEAEDTNQCPYCFQQITATYKAGLVQSIEKVLSKIVEERQGLLREKIRGEIPIDLSPFEQLRGHSTCVELMKQIDAAVKKNNDLLQRKIDNPYDTVEDSVLPVQDLTLRLSNALTELEHERMEHNQQAKNTQPIIGELHRINGEITHYDIVEIARQYDKQLAECSSAESLHAELKKTYLEKEDTVKKLEAKRSNVELALDVINNSMKYIFFAEDRLKIEYVDGSYKLLSHGHSVKPCDVSVGERNIIGLCYFFASILQGQEESRAYSNEYLLIIDDPVSSYDLENRVGILSFLRYELDAFLAGNMDTKALVMTHDLMTFYDIHKIFEEIVDNCKLKGYSLPPKFNRFELRDESIKPFQYKRRQEYTELVGIIYAYGQNQTNEQELVIGNIMRQALEAFSTFEYRKGIEEVSTNAEILSSLKDPVYEVYFKNLMYRLVLHGGSHKEEQIKTMKDFNFFSFISDSEKQRTARDILCLIYLLNKQHLLAHLEDIDCNAKATLDSWCLDIRNRSVAV